MRLSFDSCQSTDIVPFRGSKAVVRLKVRASDSIRLHRSSFSWYELSDCVASNQA
ncbi:hypothetical protein GALMADRAFT_731754 [Galerina marginata CBS 339.88]|uniref:Uncharacterized protein n=1 Tax=Galerina marginata (strain CBS 339.88) TaxID=685588 RepID=A0A067SR17_GALM3|nr:hypothetical protein GALMADRAFT_731754 [Galerina marginata CBS 339.88]